MKYASDGETLGGGGGVGPPGLPGLPGLAPPPLGLLMPGLTPPGLPLPGFPPPAPGPTCDPPPMSESSVLLQPAPRASPRAPATARVTVHVFMGYPLLRREVIAAMPSPASASAPNPVPAPPAPAPTMHPQPPALGLPKMWCAPYPL